jgi:hypothetical protein
MRLACLLAMLAACSGSGSGAEDGGASGPLAVSHPINETGHELDASTLSRVAKAIADHLRAEGFSARADPRMHAALIVQPRLTQCPGPPHPASLTTTDNDGGCLGSVTVIRRFTTRTAFTAVARTPPGGDLAQLSTAMAQAVTRGLRPQAGHAAAPEHDITATGMTVRQVGDGRFVIGDETIDLHAISHLHDPAVDTDVPEATNVTLNDTVPPMDHATITLYQVDPPLTGQPSREAGIDRGTDFRDPADLVQAAYSNYVSPVLTEDPAPIRIASHPIGHFIVKVEIPGYPTVLTGMTTIARADTELVNLTIGRQLGIGGVLLTPEPGRLNTSTEVARELALRQRRLRVVDGLYFHTSHGRNVGPEYVFDDGRVVFARVKLPVANATDALAYFVEFLHRGQQNRFGSLLNRPIKGTGAGCAAFAMSWLQAAGAIPFITEPVPDASPNAGGPSNSGEFWLASRARLHIPWRLLGCDERVGATKISSAQLTIYDLLFHGSTPAFIRSASEGLAAHIRESYGAVPATLFQIGALTPLRDLVVNGRRKDPGDRADYTWSGPGFDFSYWDNSRFAAWIRRAWENGLRDPRVTLAREGRFIGVAIDAMAAPRQRTPFFAAADRLRIQRDDAAPALTCQDVFDRGLE